MLARMPHIQHAKHQQQMGRQHCSSSMAALRQSPATTRPSDRQQAGACCRSQCRHAGAVMMRTAVHTAAPQTCSEISCTTCMGAASFSLHTRARALPPGCILETLLSWCQSCFGVGSGRDALPAAHCGGERAHAAHELRRVLAALQRQACMHLKPPLLCEGALLKLAACRLHT